MPNGRRNLSLIDIKDTDTKKLRSFGVTMGVVFVVISLVLFFKHEGIIAYLAVSAALF